MVNQDPIVTAVGRERARLVVLGVCGVSYAVATAFPGPLWRSVAALAAIVGFVAWLLPRAREKGWKRALADLALGWILFAALIAFIFLAGSRATWLSTLGWAGILALGLMLVLGWAGRRLLPPDRDLPTSTPSTEG